MTTDHPPEISDLIVDFDPDTGARRPVSKAQVVTTFTDLRRWRAAQVVRRLPADAQGYLVAAAVDDLLIRVHAEIQRLSEEFMQARRVHDALAPLIRALRDAGVSPPYRVVDVGCGTGYLVRWLAARGALGDDVELIGADYNTALIAHAGVLARAEGLRCRFEVCNAFKLDEPATIYTSIGVIHHFRGTALEDFFRHQASAGARAFLHFDIRASFLAPIGAWLFHIARMREPLAHHDGVLSAVRAHPTTTLVTAATAGAPNMRCGLFDEDHSPLPILKVMHAVVGVDPALADAWRRSLGPEAPRLELAGEAGSVRGGS